MARGAGTKLVGNDGFAHVGGGTRRGRGSCGCPPWPWPMGGPWGSLSEGFRRWRCPMMWSFLVGEEAGQHMPSARVIQEPDLLLSLFFSLQRFLWVASLLSHGCRSTFPKGSGCSRVPSVAVASLWAWKPLGEAIELQNEVALYFSVSKRKGRCGKI